MDLKAKVAKGSLLNKDKKDHKKRAKFQRQRPVRNQERDAKIAKRLNFTMNQKAITTIFQSKKALIRNVSLKASTQIYAKG